MVAASLSGKNKCWITDDEAIVGQGLEIITKEIVSENGYILELNILTPFQMNSIQNPINNS